MLELEQAKVNLEILDARINAIDELQFEPCLDPGKGRWIRSELDKLCAQRSVLTARIQEMEAPDET